MGRICNSKLIFLFCVLAPIFTGAAYAGEVKCYLYGSSPLKADAHKENFSLGEMLRMNFAADTQSKCERMITNYCEAHLKREYSTKFLKAYFKPDVDQGETVNFTLDQKCNLSSD